MPERFRPENFPPAIIGIRNQTVHATETVKSIQASLEKLCQRYPSPSRMSEGGFETWVKTLGLNESEVEAAVAQFKRILENGNVENGSVEFAEGMFLCLAAIRDPNASATQEEQLPRSEEDQRRREATYVCAAFVRGYLMYWEMKTLEERERLTKEAGGESAIQQKIKEGVFATCVEGSRNLLVEGLSEIHQDVSLTESENDIRNAMLLRAPKLIREVVLEEGTLAQFWMRLEEEYPKHKHLIHNLGITNDVAEDYFEAAQEELRQGQPSQ